MISSAFSTNIAPIEYTAMMITQKTLLDSLINTTSFAQAVNIWRDGLERAVFEPFFACFLVGLLNNDTLERYRAFIQKTKDIAQLAVATNDTTEALEEFWELPNAQILLTQLHQTTALEQTTLQTILPLAAHTAFAKLIQINGSDTELDKMIRGNLGDIIAALPVWAGEVVGNEVLMELLAKTTPQNPNDSSDPETAYDHLEDNWVTTPTRSINPMLIALLILSFLGAVSAGGMYIYNKPLNPPVATQKPTPETTPKPVVAALPPPSLSVTVGQSGELYACHAELGNSGLSDTLANILQASFLSSLCVIDINEGVSQNMQGLDKLISVLAILKTVPFASLELIGDKAYINAPDSTKIHSLVGDIGALLPSIQVMPMPTLNTEKLINDSVARATNALNALPKEAQGFQIARALNLQIIDTTKPLTNTSKAVLALAANYLKNKPDIQLIIAAHSDEMGDGNVARTNTQMVADEIKNELIANGVSELQLVARGVGFDFPKSDNQTEVGRFKNRRVEFLVYDEAILQALNQKAAPKPQDIAPSTAIAPTYQTTMPVQPVLAVQGNQIVETSAYQMPSQSITESYTISSATEPTITYSSFNNANIQNSNNGGIPDDLLKPIGSEQATDGESVQYVEVK